MNQEEHPFEISILTLCLLDKDFGIIIQSFIKKWSLHYKMCQLEKMIVVKVYAEYCHLKGLLGSSFDLLVNIIYHFEGKINDHQCFIFLASFIAKVIASIIII